jgi:formylglycine-generating enzyme required for sulfatase activity
MSDIFISYAREDRRVAERLATLLEQECGWSVFWDREILPGTAFVDVLGAELKAARHVIVLWSKASISSHWVRDEAQEGLNREVLTPVLIDAVEPPLGFRSIHAADLAGWDLSTADPRFQELVAALKGERRVVTPTPLPGRRRWRRTAVIGGAAAASMLAAAGLLAYVAGPDLFAQGEPVRPRTWEMPEGYQAFGSFRDCPDCPEMIAIPPGSFSMGASWFERDAQSDERPQVPIDVEKAFALGAREVTFKEWQSCVNDGGCRQYHPDDEGWGKEDRPVIFVSWDQAHEFLVWLTEKTGKLYRLPSEAEWEYACRAGTATKYAFGDTISAGQANYGRNTGGTREVGSYPPNAWGLSDMHGNVWEWVADVWSDSHKGRSGDQHARTVGTDEDERAIRGGSWDDPPRRVQCIARNHKDRDQRENEIGFRVARLL